MGELVNNSFDGIKDKARYIKFRETYRVTGNIREACRKTGVSENTARKWRDKGLLDLENDELQAKAMLAVGPAAVEKIIEQASQNLTMAQERVAQTVGESTARDASRIAVEQFNIMRVAQGQATEIHEFKTADETAALVNKLLNAVDDGEVIDAEAVEVE